MKEISIQSFAKINLSLDVGAPDERGYHAVDMIMQQLDFYDYVKLRFVPDRRNEEKAARNGQKGRREQDGPVSTGDIRISLRTNRPYLPTDHRNLAYKAAEIMIDRYGKDQPSGRLEINIKKLIPVAAGMAGGSGNGAAVVHGLNILWGLKLSLATICEICCELGSDVPFSAVGQARANRRFPAYLRRDAMAVSCVRARGTGTELTPVTPLSASIVIAKPRLSVSTPEAYKGFDKCTVEHRPDNDRLEENLRLVAAGKTGKRGRKPLADVDLFGDFINVLELYTLNAYPKVAELKRKMEASNARKVLMSGSGPTVFAVCDNFREARKLCIELREEGYESYWTRTTI